MGRMLALPNGAALTAPALASVPRPAGAWPGRCGARCAATPIGPMPGPPPPCGMQNVLCRFRWHTSAPMSPGRHTPTIAFMFAPSMYTWPPCAWIVAQMSAIDSSNTPCVLGYVTIRHDRFAACSAAFAFRSSTSMLPFGAVFTGTMVMPHMAALAGLVPCALAGIRQMVRWPLPWAWW